MRRIRYLLLLAVLLSLSMVAAGMARAAEENIVTLESGQTVEDDFYTAGQQVSIMGNVAGDLFVAGDDLRIKGATGGDVLAAGRTVNVGGSVEGDVRAAGQNITLGGRVERAVTVCGQQITVSPGAIVGRNLMVAGERLDLAGTVNGNVRAGVATATLSGRVDGDLEIEAENLEILPGAQVGGDVIVKAANPPQVAEGAQVKGEIKYTPSAPAVSEQAAAQPWWLVLGQKLLSLVKLLVLALLLALLASPLLRSVEGVMREKPWTGLGVGLGWLVLVPLVIVLLAVIVIGQSAAWLMGVAYISLIPIAVILFKPLMGAFLGQWLLARYGGGREYSLVWGTLLGTALLWLVGLIPVVGVIITILGVLFTMGSGLVLLARYGFAWPRRPAQPE